MMLQWNDDPEKTLEQNAYTFLEAISEYYKNSTISPEKTNYEVTEMFSRLLALTTFLIQTPSLICIENYTLIDRMLKNMLDAYADNEEIENVKTCIRSSVPLRRLSNSLRLATENLPLDKTSILIIPPRIVTTAETPPSTPPLSTSSSAFFTVPPLKALNRVRKSERHSTPAITFSPAKRVKGRIILPSTLRSYSKILHSAIKSTNNPQKIDELLQFTLALADAVFTKTEIPAPEEIVLKDFGLMQLKNLLAALDHVMQVFVTIIYSILDNKHKRRISNKSNIKYSWQVETIEIFTLKNIKASPIYKDVNLANQTSLGKLIAETNRLSESLRINISEYLSLSLQIKSDEMTMVHTTLLQKSSEIFSISREKLLGQFEVEMIDPLEMMANTMRGTLDLFFIQINNIATGAVRTNETIDGLKAISSTAEVAQQLIPVIGAATNVVARILLFISTEQTHQHYKALLSQGYLPNIRHALEEVTQIVLYTFREEINALATAKSVNIISEAAEKFAPAPERFMDKAQDVRNGIRRHLFHKDDLSTVNCFAEFMVERITRFMRAEFEFDIKSFPGNSVPGLIAESIRALTVEPKTNIKEELEKALKSTIYNWENEYRLGTKDKTKSRIVTFTQLFNERMEDLFNNSLDHIPSYGSDCSSSSSSNLSSHF